MQRNCHEFIAYENLVGSRRPAGSRPSEPDRRRRRRSIEQAVPLVRRALKVLTDREVSPQLGSAQEHAAAARLDVLGTHVRRRQLPRFCAEAGGRRPRRPARIGPQRARRARRGQRAARDEEAAPRAAAAAARTQLPHRASRGNAMSAAQAPRRPTAAGAEPRTADGIREVRRLFQSAQNPPRWPMYIRQAKQFLRNVDASFDERKYGFASLGRSDARVPARRAVPHRARSPGRHAPVPRQRDAVGATSADRRQPRQCRGAGCRSTSGAVAGVGHRRADATKPKSLTAMSSRR